jgi:nucleoside-diphosphate-sugar epimerase
MPSDPSQNPTPGTTVLVVGATGYTGQALVPVLAEAGCRVVAHIRPGSPREAECRARWGPLGVEFLVCPLTTAALQPELATLAPDVVYALLGITRAGARREAGRTGHQPTYAEVDTGMTLAVLEALSQTRPQACFVYLSSLGVGDREPANAYLRARWEVEQRLRAGSQPWVIVRPSFISGPDRAESRPMERLGASLTATLTGALRGVGIHGPWRQWAPMRAEELASALARLARDPALHHRVLEAADLRG